MLGIQPAGCSKTWPSLRISFWLKELLYQAVGSYMLMVAFDLWMSAHNNKCCLSLEIINGHFSLWMLCSNCFKSQHLSMAFHMFSSLYFFQLIFKCFTVSTFLLNFLHLRIGLCRTHVRKDLTLRCATLIAKAETWEAWLNSAIAFEVCIRNSFFFPLWHIFTQRPHKWRRISNYF